jgi:hypothetical protein
MLFFIPFLWVITLSVLHPFSLGHCIVCSLSLFFGSLHCLFFIPFLWVIALSTTGYTLIIRLILDYRNCVIIMHFGAPNPYNDTGVRYYNLLWYNCKHIYVIYFMYTPSISILYHIRLIDWLVLNVNFRCMSGIAWLVSHISYTGFVTIVRYVAKETLHVLILNKHTA